MDLNPPAAVARPTRSADRAQRDADRRTFGGGLGSRIGFPWPGWRRLPREARDTLFLLAVITWTVAPHASHLSVWCVVLSTAVLLWRAHLALVNGALPGRWTLMAVLALAGVLTVWSYGALLGKEPGVTMAVVLMALKTLELRARRDAFVVFFLGFFIILTNFLYSQSFPIAVSMIVSVWGLLTAVVLAHMPVGLPSLRKAGGLAARTALFGAPVMAILFVLFPRIGPLWGVPQDGMSSTGLSNSLRMGSVEEIAQNDTIAMRVKFEGEPPPQTAMYFRGPVLSRFDGVEWRPLGLPFATASQLSVRSPPHLRVRGKPIRYEATLEPTRLASLPLLEAAIVPPQLEGYRVAPRDDMQWLAERPIVERVRYEAEAYPTFENSVEIRRPRFDEELTLPADFNPRTIAWAMQMKLEPRFADASPKVYADALMDHIRRGSYSYTLAPGGYGRDAVDEFWLDRRVGFCEHFAATFVVIMRALGVPARIVTGYQGTDLRPVDGFYVVRESSAHAWAEYWQHDLGWVRADPTAAVAPERIDRSRRLVARPGLVADAIGTMSPELMADLRASWEALNNRWNQWVLNYSRGSQLDLMKNLGFKSTGWEELAVLLVEALSALALAGAIWAWIDHQRVDPWVRQMSRIRRALRRLGVDAAPHEPPRTLALRVRETIGDAGAPLVVLLGLVEQHRYGRDARAHPDRGLTREFAAAARRLRGRAASTMAA